MQAVARILGAVAVILMGQRFGRVLPLLLIVPVAVLQATMLLLAGGTGWVWSATQIMDGLVTYYALPLLLGTCAATEPGGRAAVWGGLASKIGLATGPVMGGVIYSIFGFRGVIILGCVGIGLAAIFSASAAAALPVRLRSPDQE